jgi:hypothetical protein
MSSRGSKSIRPIRVTGSGDTMQEPDRELSQSERLIGYVDVAELFHTPDGELRRPGPDRADARSSMEILDKDHRLSIIRLDLTRRLAT